MRRRISLLLILLTALVGSIIPAPLPLAAQNCSDEAELVEQTLDPDEEFFAPDTLITVAWTLSNSGDCTWDRDYRLIFVDGERMEGPRTMRLRSTVEPGENVTLSIEVTAPGDAESYSGIWQLRNPDGDKFGPELAVEIEVGEGEIETTDVVLPEVMTFGGMGGGGDEDALQYCLNEAGFLPEFPEVIVDWEALVYRYTTLYICSLPEGAEVLVELVDPEGNEFSRTFVEDEAVTYVDAEGFEYTGTVLQVPLAWLIQAPNGGWLLTVTGDEASGDLNVETTLDIQPVPPSTFDLEDYPELDNWPVDPIDPFTAVEGCHYLYRPEQEMILAGSYLTPNATLALGFYQGRAGNAYLLSQTSVETDDEGSFEMPFTAFSEPGSYYAVVVGELDPQGFLTNDTEYMFGAEAGQTCFDVKLEEEPEFPWRLAYAWGELNNSEIRAYDMYTGIEYFLTDSYSGCDSAEPAWWPDGEWVLYQSNCVKVDNGDFIESVAGDDYDLYASLIDPTYELPSEERELRLTETPDFNETEPDSNVDGLIVYRKTPLDASLDESGELWLLDLFAETVEETDTPLGLYGRAPTWSPDGTRIAFMSDIEGSWQIYVYDRESEELWVVSDDCPTHCRLPAWSPDGRQVIYHVSVSDDDPTPSGLWIAPVSGSGKPRLYLEGEYGRASWSYEGWIVFQGPEGIYRGTPGRRPTIERYLFSDESFGTLWAPVWSY